MKKKSYEPHYFKVREIKTGRIFFAEWSDMGGEFYEKGNGHPYESSKVEIIK